MQSIKDYEMLNKLELAEDEHVRVSACADMLMERCRDTG